MRGSNLPANHYSTFTSLVKGFMLGSLPISGQLYLDCTMGRQYALAASEEISGVVFLVLS